MDELNAFTCAWHGKPRATGLNELHYMKLSHNTDHILDASKSIDFANLSVVYSNTLNMQTIKFQFGNDATLLNEIFHCPSMGMDVQTRMGPSNHCCLRGMFCPEGWLTLWMKLDQMTILLRKVARMLICFLCRIVIRINHDLETDKSNHIMLTNYRGD